MGDITITMTEKERELLAFAAGFTGSNYPLNDEAAIMLSRIELRLYQMDKEPTNSNTEKG